MRRSIRRIEPKTVLRVSLVFYSSLYVVLLVAGIVLWIIALIAGTIHGLEHFIRSLFGYQSFHFAWTQMFLAAVLLGVVLIGLGTLLNVICAWLYNLVGEVTGGVAVTVLEEESQRSAARPSSQSGGVASASRPGL